MKINLRIPCTLLPGMAYTSGFTGSSGISLPVFSVADHPVAIHKIVPVCVEDINAVVKQWGSDEPTTYTVILSNGVRNTLIADECPPEIIEYLENHDSLRTTAVPST